MSTRDQIVQEINRLQVELEKMDTLGSEHVVVRSRDSGAWMGRLVVRNGDEVLLEDARRLYYWDGAATLSQLAIDGVSKPGNCKFPAAVASVRVLGVCEIIPATSAAINSIAGVPPWRA